MKKSHILLFALTLSLVACTSNDNPPSIEREFNNELQMVESDNMRAFMFDKVFDTTTFSLTSTDKLITKEIKAESNMRPITTSENTRTVENVQLFNIRVHDFESRLLIKQIDLVPILDELDSFVLASTHVGIFEEADREYLELRVYKKSSLSPSNYKENTKKEDFSLSRVFFLHVDLETEQFRLITYRLPENRNRLASLIPEIYKDRIDKENNVEFYDVQTAFGSESLRITIPGYALPIKNEKLYNTFPELRVFSDEAKKKYSSSFSEEGHFNGSAVVFYIYNYDSESEILSYFTEDE